MSVWVRTATRTPSPGHPPRRVRNVPATMRRSVDFPAPFGPKDADAAAVETATPSRSARPRADVLCSSRCAIKMASPSIRCGHRRAPWAGLRARPWARRSEVAARVWACSASRARAATVGPDPDSVTARTPIHVAAAMVSVIGRRRRAGACRSLTKTVAQFLGSRAQGRPPRGEVRPRAGLTRIDSMELAKADRVDRPSRARSMTRDAVPRPVARRTTHVVTARFPKQPPFRHAGTSAPECDPSSPADRHPSTAPTARSEATSTAACRTSADPRPCHGDGDSLVDADAPGPRHQGPGPAAAKDAGETRAGAHGKMGLWIPGRPWHGSSPRRRCRRAGTRCLNAHAGSCGEVRTVTVSRRFRRRRRP